MSAGLLSMWRLRRLSPWIVTIAVFGALWLMLVESLGQHWAVEPEYSFGWLVPVLCAYLFWVRWRSRPEAGVAKAGWVGWVGGVVALGLLPTWLIAQANSDWRIVAWLLAGETVVLSLGVIYISGGRGWLFHFAGSILLILAAVPWPSFLERGIVHLLTRLGTLVTVSGLSLLRVDAVQHGNAIELASGFVGLDEACSGIRSLQAGVMMSLFLGELFRTPTRRRIALVVAGVVIAFVCNSVRTISLCLVAANQGVDAIGTWHDPLGYVLMTTCFLLVLGAARMIAGPLRAVESPVRTRPVRYPYGLMVGLGVWIFFVGAGTEIWYRLHAPPQTAQWSFVWPVQKSDYAEVPISKVEVENLLFNEGRGGEWNNRDGSHWTAYFFKWSQGPSWSRILSRGHRPEICFPAAGYKPCGDHGLVTVQVNGLSIPFHALDFEAGGQKAYVFFCLWEDGGNGAELPQSGDDWSQVARLRSVLAGERGMAQQTLEIVVTGYESQDQAETAFRQEITTLINIETNKLVVDVSNQ